MQKNSGGENGGGLRFSIGPAKPAVANSDKAETIATKRIIPSLNS